MPAPNSPVVPQRVRGARGLPASPAALPLARDDRQEAEGRPLLHQLGPPPPGPQRTAGPRPQRQRALRRRVCPQRHRGGRVRGDGR